ncbi:aminotransferase class IV family protein [Roseovarius sp. SYSU LYC5161]|uniref:aminotransferase class IV family protein n=1 Tax=Roseovarius halophilus (ex Wu et al. 2025) TaxID=3376060 RepID=UPI00399B9082
MESPLRPPDKPGFRLIETMGWHPGTGIPRRDRHLRRLEETAAALGIVPRDVVETLDTLAADAPMRVRLTVDRRGGAEVMTAPFTPLPQGTVWRLGLSPHRLDSANPWLRVKTTERALYDTARAAMPAGVEELVFLNEIGELAEGTITNLFIEMGDGLLTPPVASGLLPGVLREELLATGRARVQVLGMEHLMAASAIYAGNSLRGLIPARFVG